MAIVERLQFLIEAQTAGAVRDLRRFGDTADTELERAERRRRQWATGLTVGGAAAVGFATVAGRALAGLAGDASDLAETTSRIGVLFGDSGDEIEAWAETAATSFGQSKRQALDAAATFAVFGQAAGKTGSDLVDFSTSLTELASDLASFHNTSPEEAILALGAALRGENEPIRRYGVLLDDATLKQEAMRLGLISTTSQALTPAVKVQAAYAAILAQTTSAQGDFQRTAGGAANQQRILNAQLADLRANIGSGVLPMFTGLVQAANSVAGAFGSLSPETQRTLGSVASVGVAAVGAAGGVSFLAGQALKLRDRFTDASGALNIAGKAAIGLTAAVGIVGTVLALRAQEAAALREEMRSLAEAFFEGGEAATAATDRIAAEFGPRTLEAARSIRDLALAGEEVTDRMFDMTAAAAMAEGGMFAPKARELADALREQVEALSSATAQTETLRAAQADYADLVASGTATETELAAARERVVMASREQATTQQAVTAAVEEGQRAAEQAAAPTTDLADRLKEMRDAAADAERELRETTDAILGTLDASLDAEDAIASFSDRLAAHNELLRAGRASATELAASEREVLRAALAVAEAKTREAEQQAIANGRHWSATDAIRTQRDALVLLQQTVGVDSPLGQRLNQTIWQLTALAQNRTAKLKIDVEMNAPGRAGFFELLNRVPRRQKGGPVPGRRGEPVPLVAHGGEFVLDAATVDAIRRGAPTAGLADGRSARTMPDVAGGMWVSVPITVNVNGNGTVADQVRQILPQMADAVVGALRDWQRTNGPVPIRVAG